MRLWRFAILFSLVAVSCGRDEQTATTATAPAVSAAADEALRPERFLRETMDLIRSNALYAERIDWEHRNAEIDALSSVAATTADTYPLIREILVELADHHSSLFIPDQFAAVSDSPEQLEGSSPSGDTINHIGRLRLPSVVVPAESGAAETYITEARWVLGREACGWILDLRHNGGGNLFVMLSAAAPLLGPGPTVGYRDRDGITITYEIEDDGTVVTSDRAVLVDRQGPLDSHPSIGPVAVLQDRETASSAEGLVMAFRGRPMTRSFGAPTRGVPTGNELFPLSDGSALNLTTTKGVDSLGQAHDAPIDPDEAIADGAAARGATDADETLEAGREWLARQPLCQAG